MRKSIVIFLVAFFFMGGAVYKNAFAQLASQTTPKKVHVSKVHKKANTPKKKKCAPNDRACNLNRQIEEVESEVSTFTKDYAEGSIWQVDELKSECDKKRSTKCTFRYVLLGPTYAMRAVTWPFALVVDFLIKEHVVKKVVDLVSNDERTLWVYPKMELGFGSGFGGGVGITNLDVMNENYRIDGSYVVNVNLNQRADFELQKPDAIMIYGKPLSYDLSTGISHIRNFQFYGMGVDSSKDDIAYAKIDSTYAGGIMGYEPLPHFFLQAQFQTEVYSIRSGEGASPSIEDVFPPSEISGFGKEIVYAKVGLRVKHDTRDSDAGPESGGLQTASIFRYQGLGARDHDFNEFNVELQQYVRLWVPRNIIALRMNWTFQQNAGRNGIPFFKLAALDVNSPARGFASGRFRDTGSVVFNVEYRYPIWRYLDGDFFFDTGRVFHGIKDVSFKHFKYCGGGGFRLRTKNFFLARMELAYGGEGVKFMFKTSQAF
jgi:hypothetical protein